MRDESLSDADNRPDQSFSPTLRSEREGWGTGEAVSRQDFDIPTLPKTVQRVSQPQSVVVESQDIKRWPPALSAKREPRSCLLQLIDDR